MSENVIIIGAGASAVSAAWPLVNKGVSVTMLAPGPSNLNPAADTDSFHDRRFGDDEQWKTFLGEDFGGIGANASETPKMKVPALRFIQKGFTDQNKMSATDISPTGSLVAGGLTQMWGAGAFCYDDDDLADTPISAGDLAPSYARVSERIGISGVKDDDISELLGHRVTLDDPIELHPTLGGILGRHKPGRPTFRLGRTRNAVITKNKGKRLACNLSNNCLWSCSRQSIYSAAQELEALSKHPNFTLRTDCYVDRITADRTDPDKPIYRVMCSDLSKKSAATEWQTSTLILAAGTLASTRLALMMMERYDVPQPICTHPAYAMAGLYWRRVGERSAKSGFALGHLAYEVKLSDDMDQRAFGVMFPSEGLLMSDLISNMPLTTPGSIGLTRALAPAMIVANGYVSSDHADCTMTVQRDGKTDLIGKYRESFDPIFKGVTKELKRQMKKLGVVPLPGSIRRANLGSDGHYAGGLPMTDAPNDKILTTTPLGELRGAPGVYVVDGAALPKLSVKHPTFTFMANADRISYALCQRVF
ncbi:MAG: GMC oxidoreductase [Alphaproteobacteria bacterium]